MYKDYSFVYRSITLLTMLQTGMKNMVLRDRVLLFTVYSYHTAFYKMDS